MKTECPHCGQHYEVDEEYIDQIVKCATCGEEFVVEKLPMTITVNGSIAGTENVPERNEASHAERGSNNTAIAQTQETVGKMKALVCEMCGSTDLAKQNGFFVCQSCFLKSVELSVPGQKKGSPAADL